MATGTSERTVQCPLPFRSTRCQTAAEHIFRRCQLAACGLPAPAGGRLMSRDRRRRALTTTKG